ncbi:MAG: hypothetical protein JST86_05340 [Bacteroidetes bacterium]|nr:hypothetical protein [Bacteroidota bacterium]
MTGTFKANNPYNTFLLLVYGILLKLPMFLHPAVPKEQLVDGFLYKELLKWLYPVIGGIPVVYSIIAYLLLYTQAISFNKMMNELKLMQKPNYLTGMSYLLVTSLFTEWNHLSAPLVINTLLIWVLEKMCGLYNDANPKRSLFNIGIAIGIATFFYFPSLAFAALVVFGLALTRPFKLAEWLMGLLGIITPYYFLLAIVFLTDKWKGYKLPGIAVTSPLFSQTNWAYAAIIIVLITAITGFIYVQQNFRRQLIQSRKSWNLVFLYLLVALFIPFINATHTFEYWILCAVPLSALLGAAFLYPSRKTFPLILHWLMVAFVIATSYFAR